MTYEAILEKSAAVLNDQARATYTDEVLLPYLNMARAELQGIFELNNIPVTNETSAVINCPAGTTAVGFSTTPALPADLIEIQRVWESPEGQELWTPMTRKNYLTGVNPTGVEIAQFLVWAWMRQEIRLVSCIQDNDLKLDYICHLFTELEIDDLDEDNSILNTDPFFWYRTAALAADFIEEDEVRAGKLNGNAAIYLQTSLGISVKGQQAIAIRRRPFRAAYKRRQLLV